MRKESERESVFGKYVKEESVGRECEGAVTREESKRRWW